MFDLKICPNQKECHDILSNYKNNSTTQIDQYSFAPGKEERKYSIIIETTSNTFTGEHMDVYHELGVASNFRAEIKFQKESNWNVYEVSL